MPKISPISAKELENIVVSLWFYHVRTKWSHKFFLNRFTWQTTVIPFHWNEDISIWLLKKILRDVWLDTETFNSMR